MSRLGLRIYMPANNDRASAVATIVAQDSDNDDQINGGSSVHWRIVILTWADVTWRIVPSSVPETTRKRIANPGRAFFLPSFFSKAKIFSETRKERTMNIKLPALSWKTRKTLEIRF